MEERKNPVSALDGNKGRANGAAIPDFSGKVFPDLKGIKFTIQCDRVRQLDKKAVKFDHVRARMKKAKPVEVTLEQFFEGMKLGWTWQPGVHVNGVFQQQQAFAIDFDNKPSLPIVQPFEAWDRASSFGYEPAGLYFTLSGTQECPRFRLVFLVEEAITDPEEAEGIYLHLLEDVYPKEEFPQIDRVCGEVNRLFLGSNGEVWTYYTRGAAIG